MNKKLVIIGIVVLVLGLIVAHVGFSGMLNKKMIDVQ